MSDELELKYMDAKQFRAEGYLSEVNRRILHPLGLALSVKMKEDGTEELGPIWDCRDDLEGMVFGGDYAEVVAANAARIEKLWEERTAARTERLGYMVQAPEDMK